MWSLPPHSHSRAFKSPLPQIAMGGRRHNSPLLRQKTSLLLPQQKFFLVFQTRGRYLEISFLHSNATMCQISSTSRFVFPDFRVYLTSDLSDIDYTGPEFCKRETKIVSKTFLLTLKMGGFNSFVVHHRKKNASRRQQINCPQSYYIFLTLRVKEKICIQTRKKFVESRRRQALLPCVYLRPCC